ncbi:apoptosis-inducing factor 3-like isoform X1 [Physella acuta]|uniref:apoptosis-inducing factor 3-like isoform X1 n=2 Tax=Physella acuta TaxID=109671 RepID=UPI0027DB0A46|nr:apoptosis-inducing factor 3-like isoform X1 [Physella acuta]XP_059141405.1 apoptosis-inducing factor 3-like isoform X1 [Physella acuta]XP_059141406.1 apoptosis-inducing factor 3-like isoform X1 [Physella acuta]
MGQKQSKDEAGVQVVNIKRREDALNVYPDSITNQSERPLSTSTDQKNTTSTDTTDSAVTQSGNMIEAVVGEAKDFKDGHMQEVEVGDQKVLLVKEDGSFYAIGNKCTHYGAPLSKGAYCKGVVRCPWHGACFNVKTGDIEDFPGLDSVQKFQVEVKDGKVLVRADPAALENSKRVKPMVKKSSDNNKSVVLIGGGPASVVCAETLRQEGFTGKIVLVTRETALPYDRIKLSKALSIKPEEIALRNKDFYDSHDIELKLNTEVTKIVPSEKKVELQDGHSLKYDTLVIATGGQPRLLPIPGADLKNVYTLRTPQDANAIAENSHGKNVVIMGSSFIGMEVAAFLADKAASVSVVDLVQVPFQLTLGQELGTHMKQMHEGKGVKFYFDTSVKEFKGEDGKLTEAVLANGTVLPADVCVMGVGVVPATNFLKDSGLELTPRGFVTVNKNMRTNIPDIYAAGDIVEFPLFIANNQQANVQHWQMAHQHGKIAGLSIAGKAQDIHSVPYFWTVQYGKSIRYAGYGPGYDDIILHGDVDDNKFVAFYTKNETVVAVASLGWDPIVSQAAELMSKGGVIKKDDIKSDPDNWVSKLCTL